MAIFVTPRSEIAQAVAAIWGLQLGNQTMSDVLALVSAPGGSVGAVVAGAFDASYGAASDEAVASAFVSNLGITEAAGFDAAAVDGAVAYVAGELDASSNRSGTLMAIAKAFGNLPSTGDADIDATVAAFNAKVAGAVTYSGTAGTADVTIDSVPSSTSFDLTVGRDVLTGTAGADVFQAYVFDNQNTFQSGDSINGGGGVDTLEATFGNSSNFAILPLTQSVENIFIRSQSNNWSGNNGDNNPAVDPVADGNSDDNTLDAELMRGVQQWWNTDSRADLVIEDVRILDNEITKDIAIGWANADPSSVQGEDGSDNNYGDKVDYEVYFSPESLRKQGDTTSNAIQLTVGNQIETQFFDPDAPLKDLPYTAVQFVVNGVDVALELDLTQVDTYDELYDAFTDAFDAAKAAGEFSDDLADVTVSRIEDGNTFFSRDGQLRKADVIQLTAEAGTITPHPSLGWLADSGLPSDNAFSARVTQGAAVTVSDLITSTIYLDNVGRESEAGDLVIGSMSTRTGVERFDIEVLNNDNTSGAYTSSGSWIGSASSTNNFLREVLAHNAADGIAEPDYLYIGTGMDDANNNLYSIRETFLSTQSTQAGLVKYQAAVDAALLDADGLSDVRLFDASEMVGKVKVGATISADAIEKYQDLVDTNADDGFEDVDFVYQTGSNNDSINLVLDEGLWFGNDSNSSVVPGRHDFNFTVSGNAGNDHIQVTIGGEDEFDGPFGEDEDWYANQYINDNITVNGGSGDDTIRTPGAGDMHINGDTGNDTIYTDNTGGEDEYSVGNFASNNYNDDRAAWVFNAEDNDVFDLESQGAASIKAVNARLTVDFRGYTKQVDIGTSMDAVANVTITDLTINQAIKAAINDDAVLSKLLVAEDGPGRTLIVRSLIDGDRSEDDLEVTFSSKALTTTQAAITGLTLFSPTSGTASMVALLDGYGSDFVSAPNYTPGEDATATSDNYIEGGTGNDVIVLGTAGYLWADQATLYGSNDTIIYTGLGNGTDTIVNFDTTYDGFQEQYVSDGGELQEVISIQFSDSDGSPAAQTIIFAGTTVTLSAPATQGVIPAMDVSYQFSVQMENNTLWNVTGWDGIDTVELTRVRFGEVDDVVVGDFTGTYGLATAAGGNGVITPTVLVQGDPGSVGGSLSEFTVTFNVAGTAAAADGAFTFDGQTINYLQGDGALTLTDLVAAGAYPNWTAVETDVNEVTFTALAVGATALGTTADFDLGVNTIVGTIDGTLGVDDIDGFYETVQFDGPGRGFDWLDFSAYDPAGVVVNGVTLIDVVGDGFTVGSAAPDGKVYSYIRMTESLTNEGLYTIDLVTVDDNTPVTADVVELIGVADFGDTAEVNFVPDNFII